MPPGWVFAWPSGFARGESKLGCIREELPPPTHDPKKGYRVACPIPIQALAKETPGVSRRDLILGSGLVMAWLTNYFPDL